MNPSLNSDHSALSHAVLHTLIYADIFDYPLRLPEIHRYLIGMPLSFETLSDFLQEGPAGPRPWSRVGEYFLLPGREDIVSRREARQRVAARLWPQALRYGRLIARLPFVRMLAVTGSLAMNNAEETADLDYLVVTKTGRLWLCRALILALGRVAALRGVRLCPNYLISERALEFPDHSLYAAHELAQMVPLSGLEVYARMRSLNAWVDPYLPNAGSAPSLPAQTAAQSAASQAQSMFEAALLTPLGGWIESWEMGRKIRMLRAENRNNLEAGFSADLCKGHFNRHGFRTENLLREKLERFSMELSL